MTKALDLKNTSLYFNDPEEPSEQLRAQNEQLNSVALQQQQALEAQSEQIRQLQALSEVELIKVRAKAESDNKSALLEIEKLKEDARQFNVTTTQKGIKQNEDTAVKLTELELKSGVDVPGAVV